MVKTMRTVKITFGVLAVLCAVAAVTAPFALAQSAHEGGVAAQEPAGPMSGLKAAGIALGAGLAFAGGAIGTGIVQYAVCASGIGVIAEKREMLPFVVMFVAIPETLVILGFVLAIMLQGKI